MRGMQPSQVLVAAFCVLGYLMCVQGHESLNGRGNGEGKYLWNGLLNRTNWHRNRTHYHSNSSELSGRFNRTFWHRNQTQFNSWLESQFNSSNFNESFDLPFGRGQSHHHHHHHHNGSLDGAWNHSDFPHFIHHGHGHRDTTGDIFGGQKEDGNHRHQRPHHPGPHGNNGQSRSQQGQTGIVMQQENLIIESALLEFNYDETYSTTDGSKMEDKNED